MKINKVVITNFKCYYGTCVFDFTTTDSKNVIVVNAVAGSGKTSLMEAINWALYDIAFLEELSASKGIKITLDKLISEPYKKEISKNKNIGEVRVELSCEDDNGDLIQITKYTTFVINTNDVISFQTEDHVYKSRSLGSSEWLTSSSIKNDINRLLPETIKKYFIFDAEEHRKLSKPTNKHRIQEAIFRVVGLKVLEDANEHLTEIAKEYAKESKKMNLGQLTDLQDKKELLEEKIEQQKIEIKEHKKQATSLSELIGDIEKDLRGLPDTEIIQKNIDQCKETIKQLFQIRKEKEKELSKEVIKNLPFVLEKKLEIFNSKLLGLKEKGVIPGTVSVNLLNEILASQKCICSTDLFQTSDHSKKSTKRIQELLKEIRHQSQDKQKILDIFNSTTFFISSLSSHDKSQIDNIIDKLDQSNQAIDDFNNDIKDYEIELRGLDNELIKEKTKQKDKFRKELDELNLKIGGIQNQLEQNNVLFNNLSDDLSKIKIDNDKAQILRDNEIVCREATKTLKNIFDRFTIDARFAISNHTSKEWHLMLKTTKGFNVEVDESYGFSVTDYAGNNSMHQLSSGQEQGLVLAFVRAISEVSQKYPPYIIDMPWARLDGDSQEEMAKTLPTLCDQLILLVNKGSEWRNETQRHILPKCNRVIELEFDENTRKTTIK